MNFIKQVGIEARNIFRSRFLLVIMIIVLAFGVLSPVVSLLISQFRGDYGVGIPYYAVAVAERGFYNSKMYGGDPTMPPIEVDGVMITSENPFYWNVRSLQEQKEQNEINEGNFRTPQALDLAQTLIDEQLHFYARVAQHIATGMDYRNDLVWSSQEDLFDKFILDHMGTGSTADDLIEALNTAGRGMDAETFQKKYTDLDAAARQAAYEKADQSLTRLFTIIENNDFPEYIALRVEQSNRQIADLQTSIEATQKQILDNPALEETLGRTIEEYEKQIRMLQENTIPLLQYRLDKGIIPYEDNWQNNALSDVENTRNQMIYTTVLTEEEYNKDPYLIQQYGSYRKYQEGMNRQINQWNTTMLIAQNSLDADKPDMKYAPSGARYKTVAFLDYSVFVALFAVLLGGWMLASEFQQGTIRLLMIRPKTRAKILLAKFTAALGLSVVVYLLGSAFNLVANGFINGFADFANPNYTINGSQAFFAYYVPRMLACLLPIVVGFCAAFLLGVTLRNSAVAIVIPVVAFIGCFLATSFLGRYPEALGSWLVYTPVPYVQLSAFFTPYSEIRSLMEYRGMSFNLPLGMGWLAALSVAFAILSVYVFRKRDITN